MASLQDSTMDPEPTDLSSGLLSSWKEIADYLGTTERSAQRYAKRFELPVKRIAKGQKVFAHRHELDAWMAQRSQAVAKTAHSQSGETPGQVADQVTLASRTSSTFTRSPFVVVAALVIALTVGVLLGASTFTTRTASVAVPSSFVFVGRSLQARDAAGNSVWTHDFQQEVSEARPVEGVESDNVAATQVDLDGDGSIEIIVPVRFAPPGRKPSSSDVVGIFSVDGKLKWTIQPPESLTCSNRTYAAPWGVYAVTVSEQAGPKKIWAAFNHNTWWPGIVVESDSKGQQSVRYVQTGWVMSLAAWSTPTGMHLVAGGVTNEEERPILSVIDAAGPPVMNPASNPRFVCSGAPTERPKAVFLLSNDDLGPAANVPYGMVTGLRAVGRNLKATVVASDGGQIVELSDDIRVIGYSFMDSHWLFHQQLEQTGKIGHSSAQCPDRRERHIRSWNALSGWRDEILTPAVRTSGFTR